MTEGEDAAIVYDRARHEAKTVSGRLEFHNFEPIVQMMEVLSVAGGEDLSDQEWADVCAFFQVDPEAQRQFRALLQAELDEE